MELLPEGQKNTTEVSWEDQQKINEFSKLIGRKDDLEQQLAGQRQEKEYLDDVALEIELVDEDERLNYKVGDTFVLLKQEQAVEMLEQDTAAIDAKIEKLESADEELDLRLKELKAQLYARFGTAINLER
ncbi:unnamed protein product [Kuraishia capsulata CBS 1993]|uniref:Prefoldin subunit 4 n=1 Tax=Kuraishia capsulata CBS 1993 TaxID=1382522 RepID=W6MT83_9ASCO|nr:uncharacterized protein KUCA_T00005591001 [Kuraishia capsulata CBS 1993]CDK29598.1 unnamed protein product [Kuraishia capsulata CBS 1993]